jgi:hypothetical protein
VTAANTGGNGATSVPATLAEALLILQSDPPEVIKGETARVESQKGSYSYRFAGLNAVTAAVLPRLTALGCIWVCRPTRAADGAAVLAYRLRHVPSGDEETGEFPLSLPSSATPQMLGSMLSYTRRYALLAVLGIAPEADDDDAAAASGYDGRPAAPAARARKCSKAQVTAIQAGFGDLGLGGEGNRGARLTVAARLAGLEELGSTNELTTEQARRVLDGIAERKRVQQAEQQPSSGEGGKSDG